MTTSAPRLDSIVAIPLPIPVPPPVMKTSLPLKQSLGSIGSEMGCKFSCKGLSSLCDTVVLKHLCKKETYRQYITV